MEKKENLPVIQLVKKSNIFKLIVTEKLEKKIRHLCQKQPNNEWSGTLFYESEGSFEDNSLIIKCVDVCLMDVGSSAYTEFDMSPDVINYAMEHDLLGAQMGLIHSHDKMSTFFSGTDTETLREEGLDRNHFVSLIVNNAGSYTAGITRRVKSKKMITEVYSYRTFEDEEINNTKTYEVDTDELEWYNLDIIIENSNEIDELNSRLEEIEKIKKSKVKSFPKYTDYKGSPSFYNNIPSYGIVKSKPEKVIQSNNKVNVPTSNELPFEVSKEEFEIPYEYVHYDVETIKSLALQLVTGSIIIPNESKINMFKWAAGMKPLFEKRFGTGKEGMQSFKVWADTYIEFLCYYTIDDDLLSQGYSDEEMMAVCANDLITVLSDLPKNEYIDTLINILLSYII